MAPHMFHSVLAATCLSLSYITMHSSNTKIDRQKVRTFQNQSYKMSTFPVTKEG